MNIGIVTTWFPSGGGYVARSYREVLEKDAGVFIYARAGNVMRGNAIWDDSRVTWAPWHYATTGIWKKHFVKWIRENRIEVVFFNEQRYWMPLVWAKQVGAYIGAYVDYYTQETVPAFALYDFLICNTRRHYSVFNWHQHCFYVPWGTDINKFSPMPKKADRPLTFLISSGWDGAYSADNEYMDRRGTRLAMRAFRGVVGDCRLMVFSQVPLSQCSPEWQKHVKEDPRIIFKYGTFEPFPFQEGDVYVYPSRLDGIGLSLPEAVSCGLPAIVTDSAPMNEFVEHNVTGTLVPVHRYVCRPDAYYWPESICDVGAMTDIMQLYVDRVINIDQYKQEARSFAIRKLNWNMNANELFQLIYKACFCSTPLSPDQIRLARSIDRKMEPSILWRFLCAGRLGARAVQKKLAQMMFGIN